LRVWPTGRHWRRLRPVGKRGNAAIWRFIPWWDGHPATIHRWAA